MTIKFSLRRLLQCIALPVAVLALICCSGNVEGNTGVVRIEFKSGGKAYLSAGPATTTCTYAEDAKTVTLKCVGDKTVFAVGDDGALNGPPDGLLTRLTKKK